MTDYIKREDAIKAFDPLQRRDWYTPWIVETLKGLPSADVAPVRHGRWIRGKVREFDASDEEEKRENEKAGYRRSVINWKCSECRKITMAESTIRYEFCPNCGARMDGGNDEID